MSTAPRSSTPGSGSARTSTSYTDPTTGSCSSPPPGSAASIIIGTGVTAAAPGSLDSLQLVVTDIVAARAELVAKGIAVSEVFHDETGIFHHAGTLGRVDGPDPERGSYGSFVSFEDPDGNRFIVQEVTTKAPGR